LKLNVNAVKIELTVLEQQQRPRLVRENLPTQFRANRTARAGDHHYFVADALLEQRLLRRHRITPEQIRDIDFLNVLNLNPTTGQVHEAGHTANMQGKMLQRLQYFAPSGTRH